MFRSSCRHDPTWKHSVLTWPSGPLSTPTSPTVSLGKASSDTASTNRPRVNDVTIQPHACALASLNAILPFSISQYCNHIIEYRSTFWLLSYFTETESCQIMMPTLLSLVTPQVVVMTTCGVTIDDNVGIITIPAVQFSSRANQWFFITAESWLYVYARFVCVLPLTMPFCIRIPRVIYIVTVFILAFNYTRL